MTKTTFALTILVLAATQATAQEHAIPCHATEYGHYLQQQGKLQPAHDFENWLSQKRPAKITMMDGGNDEVVTLPVVIHIIHDGDEVGISENIPDERVLSQLQVLNEDFGRIEGTPGYVEGNAGVDTGIRFCLAQQDPDGNPTNGIIRHNLGLASWNSMEAVDNDMKGATMWDPERYINIWVCRFGGQLAQVGGYAYFPEASGLDGLEGAEANADIDGIVMSFKAFGSSDTFPATTYFPQMDKGRSLTHEMGHYLGLRHIWGDGNSCDATDYCDDTPPVAGVHFMCEAADTCPDDEYPDMIENHMDYTPDACKSIFTNGQKERMWTVLENAPRRASLLESNACEAPQMGVGGQAWQQGIRLYPNPANNVLNITGNDVEGAQFEIYTILGAVVTSGTMADGVIDTSGLESGLYFVKISLEGQSKTLRLIKE